MADLYTKRTYLPSVPRNQNLKDANINTAGVYILSYTPSGDVPAPTIGSFIDLTDTPSTYLGSENYFVRVASDGSGLVFTSSTGENPTFIGLSDTPASYIGFGGQGLSRGRCRILYNSSSDNSS